MLKHAVGERLVAIGRSLCAGPLFRVRPGDADSGWCRHDHGIRQACPQSLYLFNIVMSSLWKGVRVAALEPGLWGARWDLMWELLYADDTVSWRRRRTRRKVCW